MTNMQIISCIRFCIQLLITESIYTFAFERRKHRCTRGTNEIK